MSELDELKAEVERLDSERDQARRQAEAAWAKIRENRELRERSTLEEAARLEALEPGLTKVGWQWRHKQERISRELIPEARKRVTDCEVEIKLLERSIANHERDFLAGGPFDQDRRKLQMSLDCVDAREREHRQKIEQMTDRLKFLCGDTTGGAGAKVVP